MKIQRTLLILGLCILIMTEGCSKGISPTQNTSSPNGGGSDASEIHYALNSPGDLESVLPQYASAVAKAIQNDSPIPHLAGSLHLGSPLVSLAPSTTEQEAFDHMGQSSDLELGELKSYRFDRSFWLERYTQSNNQLASRGAMGGQSNSDGVVCCSGAQFGVVGIICNFITSCIFQWGLYYYCPMGDNSTVISAELVCPSGGISLNVL